MRPLSVILILALVVFSFSETTENDRTCTVNEDKRAECGHYGIDKNGCENKGCCWKESNIQGVPWCYKSEEQILAEELEAAECAIDPKDLVECGWNGINKKTCESKDCCWRERERNSAEPWCFRKKSYEPDPECVVNIEDRIECGHDKITAEECKDKGCCWDPVGVNGALWCFSSNTTKQNGTEIIDPEPEPEPEPVEKTETETEPEPEPVPEPEHLEECAVDPEERKDCGYMGITEQQCILNGCCWKETNVPNAPWCFLKSTFEVEPKCLVENAAKKDCGYKGISKDECESKGCCFVPDTTSNSPWCYEKLQTVEKSVIDD